MKKIRSFIIIALIALFQPVQASIYYVDVAHGGSDSNSGLIGSPWATIQQAASTALAGDTVYVQAGTYAEKVTFNHSGREDALITFIGDGPVVVQGTSATTLWSGIFNINTKSYIRIQHFTIQNSYWFGIYIEASDHIYLKNNTTYHTGASGISVWHSSYVEAAQNTVRKACYQSLSTGSQECITFSGVAHFEIHHNEIYESGGSDNGGEGIDAKEDCANGKIYNNQVHDLIRLGIYADCWDKNMYNIEIYNNRIYKCGDGIVLSSENGGTLTNVNVYNNLTYSNDNFGIVISNYDKDGPRKNINIMNNTVYNNGFGDDNNAWGGGIIVASDNISGISIFNNIVSQNDAMQISDQSGVTTVSVNNNLIYGYRGLKWTSEVKGIHAMEADPLFRDADGADNIAGNADDDLNVTAQSDAINQGTNTNAPLFDFNNDVRPAESVIDIGAYEWNSIPLANKKINASASAETLIQVYPNPSYTGIFNVKCIRQIDRVEITDMAGNMIQCFASPTETVLNVSILKPGMYLIRVYLQDSCQVFKIIKSN